MLKQEVGVKCREWVAVRDAGLVRQIQGPWRKGRQTYIANSHAYAAQGYTRLSPALTAARGERGSASPKNKALLMSSMTTMMRRRSICQPWRAASAGGGAAAKFGARLLRLPSAKGTRIPHKSGDSRCILRLTSACIFPFFPFFPFFSHFRTLSHTSSPRRVGGHCGKVCPVRAYLPRSVIQTEAWLESTLVRVRYERPSAVVTQVPILSVRGYAP